MRRFQETNISRNPELRSCEHKLEKPVLPEQQAGKVGWTATYIANQPSCGQPITEVLPFHFQEYLVCWFVVVFRLYILVGLLINGFSWNIAQKLLEVLKQMFREETSIQIRSNLILLSMVFEVADVFSNKYLLSVSGQSRETAIGCFPLEITNSLTKTSRVSYIILRSESYIFL